MTSPPEPEHRTQEEARRILERRAAALARPAAAPGREREVPVLVFAVGGQSYAVESRYVVHVFPLRELTRLPGAAPPLFGVTAWRGSLLTLVDLREVLGVAGRPLPDLGRVVVLGGERAEFGVLVDTVHEIATLLEAEIRPLPAGGERERRHVRGLVRDGVQVLDGGELLRIHR